MKKAILLPAMIIAGLLAKAQYFNEETKMLYQAAAANNDTLKIYQLKQQVASTDIQSVQFNYLPKISWGATYTHLNDDIVFPDNLQQLLMGTQKLLIKEKAGIPFNSALPASVPLQQVAPIQRQNIYKTNISGQWLLFSGLSVSNGIKAYRHQQQSYNWLTQKQRTKLWLDVAEAYDKLALVYEAEAILKSSGDLLQQQTKFVLGAISNGLATPLDRKKIELAQQRLQMKILENNSSKKLLTDKLHQLTGIDTVSLGRLHPEIIPAVFDMSTSPAERPEIKALNEGILARKYKERAALSEYIPKLVAFGQYELRKKDLSLFDPQWAAGIKMQWNLFDGLAARNNARKEVLESRILEVQKKSAQDLADLGFAKMKQDYQLATDKVILKNKEVKLATEMYVFADKQYQNGLTTMTEVLNALNDVETARFGLKQAIYEQRRAALLAAEMSGTLLQ